MLEPRRFIYRSVVLSSRQIINQAPLSVGQKPPKKTTVEKGTFCRLILFVGQLYKENVSAGYLHGNTDIKAV